MLKLTYLSYLVGNAAPSPLSVQLPQPTNDEYKTDRAVLRTLLLEGLSPHSVTYDAIFTSYTLEGDSAVARFADGTSVAGSLLVGADGTRFRVAEQLIGSAAAPRDLNMRIIYGKTPVTSEVEDALHPALRRGTSFVTDDSGASGRLVLVAEMMRFNHPTAPQDYIFWALAGQNEAIFREDGDGSLLASQAARIATKLTEHWDRSVKIIIQNQSVEHTAALRMTASDFDNGPITWPTERRVTVLGDAVHCMPPTGGQGANSALHDAAVLGELLGREKEAENGWSKEVIRQYEETMRLNIGDVVGMACIGASGLLGVREE